MTVLAEANRPAWPDELTAAWDTAYRKCASLCCAPQGGPGTVAAWWAAELVGHERPAEGIAMLSVCPDRPLLFRPGQAVPVSLPERPGVWRWYSPANAPRPDGTIDLHIRAVDGGILSRHLVERGRWSAALARPGHRP